MSKKDGIATVRWVQRSVMATIMALGLLLVMATSALASTVNLYDNAGVLNQSQVRSAASGLSYDIDIYTVPNYNGSQYQLEQDAIRNLRSTKSLVIAIDTRQRHFTLQRGRDVPLSDSQKNDVFQSFKNGFGSGGYTAGVTSALGTLKSDLSSSGFGGGLIVGLIVLVIIVLVLFAIFRRRRRGFVQAPVMGNPMYNPNPYNQNYPPGYGNQGGGMNPWAAGGLGAAAGGLVGYELGKQAGEREAGGGYGGGGGGFGGNLSGGDPNAGSGGFGGGDNGGGGFGGDSGGGSFGGGDFGGGGGGGDFGGGGGSGGGSF